MGVAHYFPAFIDDARTIILAPPDEHAPLNGGVFVVKPSMVVYELGVRWLRNGTDAVWDPELGFDRVGRPRTLGTPPGSGGKAINRTQFARLNRWDFGLGSGAEQGLFFYLFHVLLRGYSVALRRNYTTHHYQSPGKPWEAGVGSGNLMLQWPYFKDLPPLSKGTLCGEILGARLGSILKARQRAFQKANRTGKVLPPMRDPVTRLRYRTFRKQAVFRR